MCRPGAGETDSARGSGVLLPTLEGAPNLVMSPPTGLADLVQRYAMMNPGQGPPDDRRWGAVVQGVQGGENDLTRNRSRLIFSRIERDREYIKERG